jgi:tRNA pseudouridine38-40 synthase
MTRWKLTIEYDGAAFCGWQKQANALSVQQALEQAIEKFCGETVTLYAAGRTDAGVHARAQVAHFDLTKKTTAPIIRDALNFHVRPNKVVVINVEQAADNFHARFDAIGRSYLYRILNRRPPLALMADYQWHVHRPLDDAAMQKAADMLIGKHDFSTFRAQNCQASSPIRTLDKLTVARQGEEITIEAAARSFLYHQVRNIVGTLAMVGTGQWSLEDFRLAFAAKDRAKGGPTAPAHGLFFWSATYPALHKNP